MDAPAPDQPTSPRTIYPVLEIKPDGEGARVTIGIGKKHGVNTSWKAHLVDEDGRPVRGGELTIRSVEQAMTRATTKLSIDTVPKGVQAHLRPS